MNITASDVIRVNEKIHIGRSHADNQLYACPLEKPYNLARYMNLLNDGDIFEVTEIRDNTVICGEHECAFDPISAPLWRRTDLWITQKAIEMVPMGTRCKLAANNNRNRTSTHWPLNRHFETFGIQYFIVPINTTRDQLPRDMAIIDGETIIVDGYRAGLSPITRSGGYGFIPEIWRSIAGEGQVPDGLFHTPYMYLNQGDRIYLSENRATGVIRVVPQGFTATEDMVHARETNLVFASYDSRTRNVIAMDRNTYGIAYYIFDPDDWASIRPFNHQYDEGSFEHSVAQRFGINLPPLVEGETGDFIITDAHTSMARHCIKVESLHLAPHRLDTLRGVPKVVQMRLDRGLTLFRGRIPGTSAIKIYLDTSDEHEIEQIKERVKQYLFLIKTYKVYCYSRGITPRL